MVFLEEFIKLRTEQAKELTHLEVDRNFQYVANPWNSNRRYLEGMIVYYSDSTTGSTAGLDDLTWYRANKDHGPSSVFDFSNWDPIGASAQVGEIIVRDSGGIFNSIGVLELSSDFTVTFAGNTAILNVVPGAFSDWQQNGVDPTTIYYTNDVLIGTSTIINPSYSLSVAGNAIVTGNLDVSGLIDGVDLALLYSTYTAHTHTIVPTSLSGYAASYPTSKGQLADVLLTSLTDGDFLSWNSSLKRWVNTSITVGSHNLGSHSDVNASVSVAPSNNQIFIYNSGTSKWENRTITTNTSTGFSAAPFSHNHDARYWTQAALAANTGSIINWNNIFGAPSFTPSNAQYVVLTATGTLSDERVLTEGIGIDITDGGANGPVTIAVLDNTTVQKINVYGNGTLIGTRKSLNFVQSSGSNLSYTVVDDSVNDRIDIEFDISGSFLLSELSDVNLTSLANGQSIVYNSTSGLWENYSVYGGIEKNGTYVGYRKYINFVSPSSGNITYSITDNGLNDSIDVEIDVNLGTLSLFLDDLQDVTIPSVSNGQVLRFSSSTADWRPATLGIGDLSNVSIITSNFPGPGTGTPYTPNTNILVYDDDISKWINIKASSLIAGISGVYLDDILDVEIATSLSDLDLIYYDQGSGNWINGSLSDLDVYTGTELSTSKSGAQVHWDNLISVPGFAPLSHSHYVYELTDVLDYSSTPPTDGDTLVWSTSNSRWEPGVITSGFSTVVSNYSTVGTYVSTADQSLTVTDLIPLRIQSNDGIQIDTDTTNNIVRIGTKVDGTTIDYNGSGELTVVMATTPVDGITIDYNTAGELTLVGGGSTGIYSGSGTVPSATVAELTDSLHFSLGYVKITHPVTEVYSLTPSTLTESVRLDKGNMVILNLASLAAGTLNVTLTGMQAGGVYTFGVSQGPNLNTINFGSSVKWEGGTPIVLTAVNGAIDIISMVYDGTYFYASYGLNFA